MIATPTTKTSERKAATQKPRREREQLPLPPTPRQRRLGLLWQESLLLAAITCRAVVDALLLRDVRKR